jgi:hypothetical protein
MPAKGAKERVKKKVPNTLRKFSHERAERLSMQRRDQRIEHKGGSTMNVPSEFAIGGVYMPPLFIASLLGTIATVVTARLLNRYRLSRHFFYPPLVLVALAVIYTVLIGTFILPS